MTQPLLAGVEAGGTKFVCGLGHADGTVLWRESVATTTPEETLVTLRRMFDTARARFGAPVAAGVASFGPLQLDRQSSVFGSIGNTPKPGWAGFDLAGAVSAALACPVTIDTDVAGAGLAEARLGGGKGLRTLAYLTVGTGVGGALILDGQPLHSTPHPEMGHISLSRHADDLAFAGVCPYHGDCLEGLASGPAIKARTGKPLSSLEPEHPIWSIVSDYLAQACVDLHLVFAPNRIVLGGGVMSNRRLFDLIRERVVTLNNGYVSELSDRSRLAEMIIPPALGDNAGLIGAFLLAAPAAPSL